MGHAEHFLRRVARLSTHHAELALGLYRDDGLVKYVLATARLPKRARRIALSLDHPKEGPFIIVARNGAFVTCLGRGMHTHAFQPVVPRWWLERVSKQLAERRTQSCPRPKT